MDKTVGTYCSLDECLLPWMDVEPNQHNRQSSEKNNKYQLLYPYDVRPDEGL